MLEELTWARCTLWGLLVKGGPANVYDAVVGTCVTCCSCQCTCHLHSCQVARSGARSQSPKPLGLQTPRTAALSKARHPNTLPLAAAAMAAAAPAHTDTCRTCGTDDGKQSPIWGHLGPSGVPQGAAHTQAPTQNHCGAWYHTCGRLAVQLATRGLDQPASQPTSTKHSACLRHTPEHTRSCEDT